MSNDETGTNVTVLPTKIDFSALKRASASMRRITSSTKGAAFLKFNADGHWVYGKDDTRVEEGSLWAVNTPTLKQGFKCWADVGTGAPLGEEMRSVYGDEPMLTKDELPHYEGGHWEHQFSFHLQCLTGADRGQEVVLAVSNEGGRDAVDELFVLLTTMNALDISDNVPLITLPEGKTRKTKFKNNQVTPDLRFAKLIPQTEAIALRDGAEPEEPTPAPASRRRTR